MEHYDDDKNPGRSKWNAMFSPGRVWLGDTITVHLRDGGSFDGTLKYGYINCIVVVTNMPEGVDSIDDSDEELRFVPMESVRFIDIHIPHRKVVARRQYAE